MKFPPVSQSFLTAVIKKNVLSDNRKEKKRTFLRSGLTINKPFLFNPKDFLNLLVYYFALELSKRV